MTLRGWHARADYATRRAVERATRAEAELREAEGLLRKASDMSKRVLAALGATIDKEVTDPITDEIDAFLARRNKEGQT